MYDGGPLSLCFHLLAHQLDILKMLLLLLYCVCVCMCVCVCVCVCAHVCVIVSHYSIVYSSIVAVQLVETQGINVLW